MTAFGKSQTTKRFEDVRFLTGGGRYLDDTVPEAALHAFFVRSPYAHADLLSLDVAEARAKPGVHAVLTAADLKAARMRLDMVYERIELPQGGRGAKVTRPVLATDRVRYVGEPVAVIVAETMDRARDAAEAVVAEYAERDVHLAVAPGGVPVHDDVPDNVVFDWHVGDAAAVKAAFGRAAHVVRLPVHHNRVIANPMEPRGAYAEWLDGRLHVAISAQGVWPLRDELARAFRLKPDQVRVTTPDVGGGFGMKAMGYPEYAVIAQAARMTGRPVRWIAERTEGMLSDNGGRGLEALAEMAFDKDHRILAYRVEILSNLGAYSSNFAQFIQSELFAKVLTGSYDIPAAWMGCKGIFTNTCQIDAYRGAGRPEAIMTLERVMDMAARQLGADPWELRRRNFIRKFPHRTATGSRYDVGDFARVLARARSEADAEGFGLRREKAAKAGKHRGMGIAYYIESILGDRKEAADIAFEADGSVSLMVGTQSNGQGHETVYAQFLSDRTGIPVERISIVQGDSDRIEWGGGTGGSRSVTVQSNATLGTVTQMIAAMTPFVAAELGVAEADVAFDDGAFRAKGANRFLTVMDVADRARVAGRADLLRHRAMKTLSVAGTVPAADAYGLNLSSTITGPGSDTNLANNEALLSLPVTLANSDLSVQWTKTPAAPLRSGLIGEFALTLSNSGPDPAQRSSLIITAAAPANDVTIEAPAGWACQRDESDFSRFVVECINPVEEIAVGANAVFNLQIRTPLPDADGLNVTARISSIGTDGNPGNDSSAHSVAVKLADADLSAKWSGGPTGPYRPGDVAECTLKLDNRGRDAAWTPTVSIAIDAPFENVTFGDSGNWSCEADYSTTDFKINCIYGTELAPRGQSPSVFVLQVVAPPRDRNKLNLKATIDSAYVKESNRDNNTSTRRQNINGPPGDDDESPED